jgi:hypothetical protein
MPLIKERLSNFKLKWHPARLNFVLGGARAGVAESDADLKQTN